jgi:hypothetical protein
MTGQLNLQCDKEYCDALPGNGSINTFKHATIEEAVFPVRGPCREDIREYGNRNSVQLSVGGTHGKFIVEEDSEDIL